MPPTSNSALLSRVKGRRVRARTTASIASSPSFGRAAKESIRWFHSASWAPTCSAGVSQGLGITMEARAAEHQVKRHGDERHGDQGDEPGDRPLGRAPPHHRVDREQQPGQLSAGDHARGYGEKIDVAHALPRYHVSELGAAVRPLAYLSGSLGKTVGWSPS